MDGVVKCLTVCQPYAELIAMREKRIENRSWSCGYRGPLVIHAGKSKAWLSDDYTLEYPEIDPPRMAFGAAVCVCCLAWVTDRARLFAVEPHSRFHWAWEHPHRDRDGWYWILESIVRLEQPIAMRGERGLYDLEPPIIARIEKQLGRDIWKQLADPAVDAHHARQQEMFNGET